MAANYLNRAVVPMLLRDLNTFLAAGSGVCAGMKWVAETREA